MTPEPPEPQAEPGIANFAKRVLRAGVREAAKPVRLDTSPGERWLRKHRREGSPRSFHACRCHGCVCGRLSRYGMPCHPCSLGRHAKSPIILRAHRQRLGRPTPAENAARVRARRKRTRGRA